MKVFGKCRESKFTIHPTTGPTTVHPTSQNLIFPTFFQLLSARFKLVSFRLSTSVLLNVYMVDPTRTLPIKSCILTFVHARYYARCSKEYFFYFL